MPFFTFLISFLTGTLTLTGKKTPTNQQAKQNQKTQLKNQPPAEKPL